VTFSRAAAAADQANTHYEPSRGAPLRLRPVNFLLFACLAKISLS
jgi:hypothetical protein